jgi:hypothetical protein
MKSYRPEGDRLKLQMAPITGDEVNREDHDLAKTGLYFHFFQNFFVRFDVNIKQFM